MGLPSKRRTASSKKRRASHFAITPVALAKCPQCGKAALAHHACEFCGTYKGKAVIKIKTVKKAVGAKAKATAK